MNRRRTPSFKKKLAQSILASSQYSQPRITLALLGSILASAVLFASSISLVYASTPVKSVERLSSGALTSKLALTGKSRISHRLSSGNLKTAALAGKSRVTHRLSSGFLGGKTSLSGKIRDTDRLTGTLGFAAGHQLITGTTRDTARLLATGISITSAATPSRDYPRLRGALLGGKTALTGKVRANERDIGLLTSKLSLTGKVRASDRSYAVSTIHPPSAIEGGLRAPARLKGATLGGKVALTGKIRSGARDLGQLQFQGTTTSVSGKTRDTGRLLATGISLVYTATPTREPERLRGATLGFTGTNLQLTGKARTTDRLSGRLGLVYDLAPLVNSPRLLGASLIQKRVLTGTVRSPDRLRGANLSFPGAPLAGTARDLHRLKGAFITGKVSLAGTIRDASLLQDATLNSKLALTGTTKASARDVGSLHFLGATQISGTSMVLSRIDGADLTGKVSLAGTIVDQARLSSGFLGGKTSLAGVARASDRTQPSAFSVRLAIAGKSRATGFLSGSPLLLKSTTGMNGTCFDYFRVRGATLTGKSFLVGTARSFGLLQDAFLESDLAITGLMRGTSARLANGLNPIGEPYRILDSTDHAVTFVASDRPFTMTFEKT